MSIKHVQSRARIGDRLQCVKNIHIVFIALLSLLAMAQWLERWLRMREVQGFMLCSDIFFSVSLSF